MNKIINLILIFSAGLVFVTCSDDLLDKKPLDSFTEESVWSDRNLTEGFVFDVYNKSVGLYKGFSSDDYTDNIINNSDNGFARNVQTGSLDNNVDVGWNKYDRIRACNLIIEKMMDNEALSDADIKLFTAEAKMMRAMIYFFQVRTFGGVMLVEEVLTQEDIFKLPRASESDCYDFIIKDLEDAAVNLPDEALPGKFTQGAAYAFLSRVALQAGRYDKVIEAANEVEGMPYSLDENYGTMFSSFDKSLVSPEVILHYYRDKVNTNFIDTRMFRSLLNVSNGSKLHADAVPQLNDEFQGWPLRWPSQSLVDDYLVVENGQAVQKKGIDFQGQSPHLMWQNRDLRLEASIVRDSATFFKSVMTFRVGGNAHWTSNPLSTWGMPKSGYSVRKWFNEENFIFWNYPTDWAEPILRLGEVYLNKAEAYGRKSDIPKAVEYMNKTRTIHGGLPALVTSDPDEFWEFYKIERRVDRLLEDDRYWSLIRWARAENATFVPELEGPQYGLNILEDGLVNVEESPWGVTKRFELPKRLFFPVPLNEIQNNEALDQNDGWN